MMRMWCSIVLLVQFLMPHVLCDFPKEKYVQMHNTCVGRTNIDETLIEGARKGDFAQDDTLKAYIKCILDEEDCFNDDGFISEEKTVNAIPQDYMLIFETPVRDCVKEAQSESNPLESSFQMTYCVYTKTLDKFFLP